jgi:hypothetical protein
MNKFLFPLLGCLIPVWQRVKSLFVGRLGRTRQKAAHTDTPRRSFPIVNRSPALDRTSAGRHCRIRAPRVRFPGIATPRNAETNSNETKRLAGLRPPLRSRPSPPIPFAPGRRTPITKSYSPRQKDVLAEAGIVLPPSSGGYQWRQQYAAPIRHARSAQRTAARS